MKFTIKQYIMLGTGYFVILLLGDPHLLECGEGSKNRSSNPDRVLALRRSNNDLHCGRSLNEELDGRRSEAEASKRK